LLAITYLGKHSKMAQLAKQTRRCSSNGAQRNAAQPHNMTRRFDLRQKRHAQMILALVARSPSGIRDLALDNAAANESGKIPKAFLRKARPFLVNSCGCAPQGSSATMTTAIACVVNGCPSAKIKTVVEPRSNLKCFQVPRNRAFVVEPEAQTGRVMKSPQSYPAILSPAFSADEFGQMTVDAYSGMPIVHREPVANVERHFMVRR
jgi:hypothetical protein